MTINQLLQTKRQEILALAKRHGAYNLRVFGSVVRGEATQASDVDFLVDMEQQRTLFDYVALIQELEDLLGCKVDVAEPDSLHPLIRERIIKEAILISDLLA